MAKERPLLILHCPADPGAVRIDGQVVNHHWGEDGAVFQTGLQGALELGPPRFMLRPMAALRPRRRMLEKLQTAADPREAVRRLDEAEITQLGNEILQVMGETLSDKTADRYGDQALGGYLEFRAVLDLMYMP